MRLVALGGFFAACALRMDIADPPRANAWRSFVPAVAGFVLALFYYVAPGKAYISGSTKVNMPSMPMALAAARLSSAGWSFIVAARHPAGAGLGRR
jgi:hypothetical protein